MQICRGEVEKAVGPMLKYAYALSRDSDLACDLVQDSVVKALSARNLPSAGHPYRPWLFSILRNVFLDHLRRKKRLSDYTQMLSQEELAATPEPRMEESLINRLTVRRGLDRLSMPHREILVLIDVAGFSYGEAADLLKVPVGTVMSRLSRARQSLRQEISSENLHTLDEVRVAHVKKAAK